MKNNLFLNFFICALLLFTNYSMSAQNNNGKQDPLFKYVYPPELIMHHQQKIGLSSAQRTKIIDMVGESQKSFNLLHWELQSQSEALLNIIKNQQVDETAALEQIDKILVIEKKIKKAQISLFIRIKNQLTAEQQSKLDALKPG